MLRKPLLLSKPPSIDTSFALMVTSPPLPLPKVEVDICPPLDKVSDSVSIFKLPALPVDCVSQEIMLG